jgi:hypothetical protein
MNLSIIPYECNSLVLTNCYSSENEVMIYNKVRHNFKLKVGRGLLLKNLYFDSLDSIMGNK